MHEREPPPGKHRYLGHKGRYRTHDVVEVNPDIKFDPNGKSKFGEIAEPPPNKRWRLKNVALAERLINTLTIPSQETGQSGKFMLYPEQVNLLKELCHGEDLIVLKSRQIGSTTLCLAYLALHVVFRRDISIGIVAQKEETAKKLCSQLRNFVEQTGLVKFKSDNLLAFLTDNNVKVTVLTAGNKDIGRGYSFNLILCSEAAHYKNSIEGMTSLMNCKIPDHTQVIFESTAQSGDNYYYRLWHNENAPIRKFFSSYEKHPTYKSDPEKISDDEWDYLRKTFHFTDRRSASYWWQEKDLRAGGDIVRHLRENPIIPQQAWSSVEGRWINKTPLPLPSQKWHVDPRLEIFSLPERGHTYVFGIDTASGKGLDDSVIAVYDATTMQAAAIWNSNTCDVMDFFAVIKSVYLFYLPSMIFFEHNSIGESLFQELSKSDLKLPLFKHHSNNKSVFKGFLWVKNQVENNNLRGNIAFSKNCESCEITTTPTGAEKFAGRKDIISAFSFIGCHFDVVRDLVRSNVFTPRKDTSNTYSISKEIKNGRRR